MDDKKISGWVTAADVAKRAGVSRSAVSRTFTPGASVAEETRKRVLAASQELGYQVNILARSVMQQQSNLVGLVVSGFESPFVQKLLAPLTRRLSEHGFSPLLVDAGVGGQIGDSLRHLLQYRISGVILTSGSPSIELAREYARLRVPVAMINRAAVLEGVDVICSDNRYGGRLAAQCLIDSGARRLAYVYLPTGTHSGMERGAGFSEAVARSGRTDVSFELIRADAVGYEGGAAVARSLMKRAAGERPDGVFCATDALAFGFLDVVRQEFGLRVPEDVALVGFDDIAMADAGAYALSTVRQDTEKLACETVERLIERMAVPDMATRTFVVPVSIIERKTSQSKGGASPSVHLEPEHVVVQ